VSAGQKIVFRPAASFLLLLGNAHSHFIGGESRGIFMAGAALQQQPHPVSFSLQRLAGGDTPLSRIPTIPPAEIDPDAAADAALDLIVKLLATARNCEATRDAGRAAHREATSAGAAAALSDRPTLLRFFLARRCLTFLLDRHAKNLDDARRAEFKRTRELNASFQTPHLLALMDAFAISQPVPADRGSMIAALVIALAYRINPDFDDIAFALPPR
jgi:hypothetical protein